MYLEVQSYGSAWHQATVTFVEKFVPISVFLAFLEARVLEKVLM